MITGLLITGTLRSMCPEELAGEESVLDLVRGDGRVGAGPGCGPGDSSAGVGDYYGDGSVR